MLNRFSSILIRFAKPILAMFMGLFYLVIMNDPIFGDGISTISRAAFNIMDSGFTEFSYPENQDPGHPTLFPLFYAILWTIFGKTLAITHLFNIVFAVGTLWLVHSWVKEELNDLYALLTALLLLVTPLFMAQAAMVNTHLPLTFFTLLLAFALNKHWKYMATIAASLLLLCHLQGVFCFAAVGLWWFFIHLGNRPLKFRVKKATKLLLLPLALFAGWLYYHYMIKGWFMSTPASDFYGRGYGGLKISLINWIVSFWRMVDYGMLAFVIPLVLLFFKKKLFKNTHTFLILFLIIFGLSGFMFSFTTTLRTAHRYFLPALPFLAMAAVYYSAKFGRKSWLIGVILLLMSGHFWNYPGRTVGDATLAYRNIFPLLEQMNELVEGDPMYTFSPLSDAKEFAYLGKSPVHLKSLYDKNYRDVNYVLRGNVSGDFSDELIEELDSDWNSHTLQKGQLYLTLYVHPQAKAPVDQMLQRRVGTYEKWFKKMKKQLRNE
jgi:4-amino-4-deoxy-L-arabinose transferase-like glycosyltransferase